MERKKLNQKQKNKSQRGLENQLHLVITLKWFESEKGSGPKPEGYSLHKDYKDHREYTAEHDERRKSPATPNEYSFPNRSPSSMLVSQQVYNQVIASENGIWISNSMYSYLKHPEKFS